MNKTFLMSREKILDYATTKFGNDITFLLSEQRVVLVHTSVPIAIDHTRPLVYGQRQNEIEAKEFRAEFRKLQNDIGMLYGILWDQCDPGMKNKVQSDLEYVDVSKILNVIGLLTIIKRILLRTNCKATGAS